MPNVTFHKSDFDNIGMLGILLPFPVKLSRCTDKWKTRTNKICGQMGERTNSMERICEIMNVANHVYDVEIPERISKKVMELFQEAKNANKPKKGKGGKGKKKKK